jgi:hypothetical protein
MIKSHFVNSGAGQAVQLQLDTDKYSSALQTPLGVLDTIAAGTQVYPYRSIKAALKSGAIIRLKLTCKLTGTKKTRTAFVVCDKDKASTARAALIGLKIGIGAGAGVPYDIVNVQAG